MFHDMRVPEKVYAGFDRTEYLVETASHQDPIATPQIHVLENHWIDLPCDKQGSAAAGVTDKTKCKQPMLNGRTAILRHIEYHASRLRKNSAAHCVRTHEEYEFLYVARGKVIVSLMQPGPYENVLYRQEVKAGGLAYYPAWQSHGVVAVDEPQASYVAIRWLGEESEKPIPASNVRFWSGLHEASSRKTKIKPSEVSRSQSMSVNVKTASSQNGDKTVNLDRWGDTLVLVTRGSITFEGKRIETPGTVFVPQSNSTGSSFTAKADSRAVIVVIKPWKAKTENYNHRLVDDPAL